MDYPVSGNAPNTADAIVPHAIDGSGNAVPVSAANPLPVDATVTLPEDTVTLAKSSVTLNGSSQTLVSANASRAMVIVSSAVANSAAAVDPTGGAASLTAGLPLAPGGVLIFTGKMAESAMTAIGTNGQNLTVYTG